MLTSVQLILLLLLGSALIVVAIGLLRYAAHRTRAGTRPVVRRSVVYLIDGSQLLVMQQDRKGRLRSRLEVPKGKARDGESDLDAAYRECREESGLRPDTLEVFASFQTAQRMGKQRGTESWTAFWGSVPTGTTVPFQHRVRGTGRDRGRVYRFRLVPLTAAELHPPLDRPLPALQQVLSEAQAAASIQSTRRHG